MKKSPIILYAAVLAAVVSLSSCGAGSDDPPAAKTTPPVVSTSKPSPSRTTTAAPATAAGPTFPKGVPADARKHTKEGSVAFVKHFIGELNRAWTKPDPGLLEPLCTADSSKSCAAMIRTATDLKAKHQRYDRDPVSIKELIPLAPNKEQFRVVFIGLQERASVVDSSGQTVLTDPQESSRLIFLLVWGDSGWVIDDFSKL